MIPPLDLLVPTVADLAGWGGAAFAALALMGLGRLVSGGAARPEAALIAGWGAASLVLTLWGVATPASLRAPAILICALGFGAQLAPRLRLARAEWLSLARMTALALPFFAVLASARPAEPDTFLNLLPNAAYLYDHAGFPGLDRAAAHSYLPAAPYNLQLAAFIAALPLPSFSLNVLIAVDFALLLAAGLMLARLAAGGEEHAPSWAGCALGLLLATAFNPGFAPRVFLAGYSDPAVTVALAFAMLFAARALLRIEAGQRAFAPLLLFALALAALVNIKQDAVALALAVVATAAVLALKGRAPGRGVASLAVASLPAAMLYLAWRWYVLGHMPEGEITLLPRALWQPGAVGLILLNMLAIVARNAVFYAGLAATIAAAAVRRRRDPAGLMGALLAGAFVLYSAALIAAYIALFPGTMGSDAHSYFRYSTHLSLAMMAAIVLLARDRVAPLAVRLRFAPALLVAVMLLSPVAFLRVLRFDLEPPALRVWGLAAKAAPFLGADEHVALILPGDNGSVAATLGTVLRLAPPRRPDLDLEIVKTLAPDTLDTLAARGFRRAILSCTKERGGALLERDASGWHETATVSYAPAPPGRWSHVLSYAPLCLD
ncbi:MAG TPA: hypothetical protein VN802_21215 [Stellaceae bacterium]|nr:hypothetical protein [Stellaceae bacterium]